MTNGRRKEIVRGEGKKTERRREMDVGGKRENLEGRRKGREEINGDVIFGHECSVIIHMIFFMMTLLMQMEKKGGGRRL